MLILYNLILTLLSPIWVPWMLFRAWRRKEQPSWKERCGDYNLERRKDNKRIWVHAVSVGEVVASTPILKQIKELLPDHEIVLTVTTSSGHQTAKDTAQGLYDHLFYFPIDVNRFQAAAMQRVQPAVIAVMETELWPNFLWWAKVFDTKTLLINGRISDRSFKRSKGLKAFYKMMLKNVDRCLMQTEADAERIKALGARTAEVFGNAKFDQAAKGLEVDANYWRQELGLSEGKPVIVIGSTRGEEEEKFVLQALQQLQNPDLQVIHAPRHIERVPDLVKLLRANGIEPILRSQLSALNSRPLEPNASTPQRLNAGSDPNTPTPQHRKTGPYLILDTYGELDQVYSVADIVVIGGGFSNLGGQNLLQPLAQGKPVLHGPHVQNFREVAEHADKSGAAKTCETPDELAQAITQLLNDPNQRAKMGEAARALVLSNTGASRRYAEAIADEARIFHSEAKQ